MDRRHLIGVLPLLMLWAGAWIVTVATWGTDPAGYSVGMNPFVIPLHLLLPFLIGTVVAGARPHAAAPDRWRTCGIAGGLFGLVHYGVFGIVALLWIPPVSAPLPHADFVAEAVAWAIGYVIVCILASVAGGRLVTMLAARLRTADGSARNRPTS